jgi:hemerythrin-like domain-containing protein
MNTISEAFAAHHKVCDEIWAEAEQHAAEGRWQEAEAALARFLTSMAAHLRAEEELLFPAFEAATGMQGGPTMVMRLEHDQLRSLFKRLEAAVARHDADTFAGAGETMLVLMQQHNLKEEHMLYPMCDQALPRDAALLERLQGQLKDRAA